MVELTALSNGLRVVTESIPHVRSVAVGLWIGAGSRLEPADRIGVSHFVEHLLFKGTETRSARQLAEAIDRIGGHMNAFTTKEYTCYYVKILDEHLHEALDLLADMLLRSRFDPADIEKERGVVLEEFKLYEDTPDELVHDLVARCLWPDHPLGRAVLGSRDALQHLDRDVILDFYRQFYTPDNAVLVAVGRVDHERVVDAAAELFGAWAPAGRPPGVCEPPRASAARCVRVKDTEQVHFCLGAAGSGLDDPELYATLALVNLLGGGSSSRLFQEIREERGLTYAIYAFQNAYRDVGLFGVYAGTSPETASEVLELTLAEFEKLCREPVDAEELLRTKEQLKTNLVLSLESTSARMSRIGKSELLLGRLIDVDEVIRWLDRVDPGQLQEVAQRLLDPSRLAVAAVAPVENPFNGLSLHTVPAD